MNESLSPRQPAQKRTKEAEEVNNELHDDQELTTLNELKWVIHTIVTDIDKR